MKRICELNASFGNLHGDVFFLGEPVSGNVQIIPNQDLQIEHFGYHFILEARGKINTTRKVVFTKYLVTHDKFFKDQEYNFEINFKYDLVAAYTGRNTNFITRLEFFIKVDGKTTIENSASILSKIVNVFKDNTYFTENIYLTFNSKKTVYSIVDSSPEKVRFLYNDTIIIFSCFIFFIMLIAALQKDMPPLFSIVIGIIVFSILSSFVVAKQIIGELFIDYQNSENNQFIFKLSNDKKWKYVKEVSVAYEVREEIIDRRGTTDTTIVENIFKSSEISKKNPSHEISFNFDVSDIPNKIPGSIEIGDSKIYWVCMIKVKSVLGFVCKYENEFTVKKQ